MTEVPTQKSKTASVISESAEVSKNLRTHSKEDGDIASTNVACAETWANGAADFARSDTPDLAILDFTDAPDQPRERPQRAKTSRDEDSLTSIADNFPSPVLSCAKDALDALLLQHVILFGREFERGFEVYEMRDGFAKRTDAVSYGLAFQEHVQKITAHLHKYKNRGRQNVLVKHVVADGPAPKQPYSDVCADAPTDLESSWRVHPERELFNLAEDDLDKISFNHLLLLHNETTLYFRAVDRFFDPKLRGLHVRQALIYSKKVLNIAEEFRKKGTKGKQEITFRHEHVVERPARKPRRSVRQSRRSRSTASIKKRARG